MRELLLNLSPERMPVQALPGAGGRVMIENIFHEGSLWRAKFNPANLGRSVLFVVPLVANSFHLSAGFFPPDGVELLETSGNRRLRVKGLIIGTGPTRAMSLPAIFGEENISTHAKSYEQYKSESPRLPEFQFELDEDKVSSATLFLAFAEEAARLYFLQSLRAVLIDGRPGAAEPDPFDFGRYTLFNDNCVASATRNISHALRPDVRQWLHNNLPEDVVKLDGAMNDAELRSRLELWSKVQGKLEPLLNHLRKNPESGGYKLPADVEAALELAKDYKRGFGGGEFNVAFPPRAKRLVEFVTLPRE
jgi:hypothetical protein